MKERLFAVLIFCLGIQSGFYAQSSNCDLLCPDLVHHSLNSLCNYALTPQDLLKQILISSQDISQNGVYFYQLSKKDHNQTQKLIFMK